MFGSPVVTYFVFLFFFGTREKISRISLFPSIQVEMLEKTANMYERDKKELQYEVSKMISVFRIANMWEQKS